MVVVRTPRNRYFDEAHFLLREGRCYGGESERSMMAEANRILDECMLMPQPRRRKRLSRLAAFLVGVLVGAAALLGAVLLL
jgi:hypothetical protein